MLNIKKFTNIVFKQSSFFNPRNFCLNKSLKIASLSSVFNVNKFNTNTNKKHGLTYWASKNFSTDSNQSTEKLNKESDQNEEIMKYFNEEYERALASNEEDQEKRVKLLSVKLLQLKKAKDILNLFEEKYIKGLVSNIYGEELTLFIYFYVSMIEKEISLENLSHSQIRGKMNI